MKEIVEMKCPSCGAALSTDAERDFIFCQYCGTKVLINDSNKYTYRRIDEAEIKRAETERLIQMQQMELEEKKRIAGEKNRKLKIIASAILGVVGIVFVTIGYGSIGSSGSGIGLAFPGMFCLLGALMIWQDEIKKDKK